MLIGANARSGGAMQQTELLTAADLLAPGLDCHSGLVGGTLAPISSITCCVPRMILESANLPTAAAHVLEWRVCST